MHSHCGRHYPTILVSCELEDSGGDPKPQGTDNLDAAKNGGDSQLKHSTLAAPLPQYGLVANPARSFRASANQ
jgi:hypothetical protein